MSAYIYLTKLKIITLLTYRFEFFSSIGINIIIMFASLLVWKAVYNGAGTVAGLDEKTMITYTIVSILISSIFNCNVEFTMNSHIHDGQIAADFIRPISPIISWLFEDIGESLNAVLTKSLPLFIIAALFFGIPAPYNLQSAILFIPSCILSFSILWLLSALNGSMAFWLIELGHMGIVKNCIIQIFSGSMVPLWFFPKSFQTVSHFLPFKYTYQTPLGIYIGKLNASEATEAMLIQVVWIIILGSVFYFVWNKAKKLTLVQGG